MKPEDAKRLMEVLQWIADGEEVEYRPGAYPRVNNSWLAFSGGPKTVSAIFEYRKKPKPVECWINFYPNGTAMGHPSREDADKRAVKNRIACIKFTYTTGEGL